jgi:hypothetical protein
MGWNGSSTYGVRVDTSRYADSAGSASSASSATNATYTTYMSTQFLGTGSMNVSTGSCASYRNENGSGGNYSYSPVLHMAASDTMWQLQGSYGGSGNGTMQFRQGYAGSWGNWLSIITSANIGSQSVSYASSAGSLSSNATASNIYNNGWFRNNNANEGVYSQPYGVHFYSNGGEGWVITGSGGNVMLQLRSNHQSTLRGYVYADTSNNIGFLDNGGNWSFRTNGNNVYAYAYRGSGNVAGTGEATYHPAGIYSTGTNWLYGTMYRNGTSTYNQGWMFIDWDYGMSVVGVYSSTRLQGVFAMGDTYKLPQDGTSAGNLYGIAWSHPNAGGQAGYLTNHGSIHMMYGTAFVTLSDTIWCRGNITAYSDIRVKENIQVIDNAIDKINAIRGVTFTRNDIEDTHTRHAGVIAQEVLKVLPEVITTNKTNGHHSVSYGNLSALFIEGIKEHDVIIKKQQVKIEDQQQQIEELKQLIYVLTK